MLVLIQFLSIFSKNKVICTHPFSISFLFWRVRENCCLSAKGVSIDAINAADYDSVPQLSTAGEITRYEEERIIGYFGGGYLYANTDRQEPFL